MTAAVPEDAPSPAAPGEADPGPPAAGVALLARSLRDDAREGLFSLLANSVAGSALVPRVLRLVLYRLLGMDVRRANVRAGCVFVTRHVTLGHDAMVNRNCFFDNGARITLGARVRVGPEVMFCTSTHVLGGPAQRAGAREDQPVTVGDGVWIGTRAVLLPGVTVGEGCVVAAGAVVTSDCDPHGMYAGVPARRVRDLPA